MRRLVSIAALAATLVAGPAGACYFHGSFDGGFASSYPGSISIAVATRAAVEEGLLDALPEEANSRAAALYRIRVVAGRSVMNMAAVRVPGPPVFVLLTQSGTWIRLNDPASGAVFHSDPPGPDDTKILLSDQALEGLLTGNLSVDMLEEHGLIRIHGNAPEHAREIWARAAGKQSLAERHL